MAHSLVIQNGRVVDPQNNIDAVMDVLIVDGKIAQVDESINTPADETIDATGQVVCPGLIDMQVHFREPGREDQETLESGSRAALAGGVTSVVVMPNLNPVADNQTVVEFITKRARELDLINIYPTGSITQGQDGARLSEIQELKNSGSIAITDDGVDVQDEGILKRAMEYAQTCDVLLMSHCENEALSQGGVMHEGWVSTQMGVPGIPAVAEDMAVSKNIMLAQATGARLHLLHNSTTGAMDAIRTAKQRGFDNITAEVSVQHFALTDEACLGYNTNAKMYPPLRSQDHVDSIIAGIVDDTVDAFTTDHAPHTQPDKLKPFEHAANGFIGLETSLAVVMTYLVHPGHTSLSHALSKMTTGPAHILRINKGHLSVGADGDVCIFNPDALWTVDAHNMHSKGVNTPFDGVELTGQVTHTIVNGVVKYVLN